MKLKFYSLLSAFFLFSVSIFAQVNDDNAVDNQKITNSDYFNSMGVAVYPQPSSGPVNIRYSESQVQNPKVMVYDIIGNLVSTIESERINPTTFAIDLSMKKPGYYFVKIEGDAGTVSRRITIKF